MSKNEIPQNFTLSRIRFAHPLAAAGVYNEWNSLCASPRCRGRPCNNP